MPGSVKDELVMEEKDVLGADPGSPSAQGWQQQQGVGVQQGKERGLQALGRWAWLVCQCIGEKMPWRVDEVYT